MAFSISNMRIKSLIRQFINKCGYGICENYPILYDEDGLLSRHNHDFVNDAAFIAAYNRGAKACKEDYGMRWRVHVALWAASQVKDLPGDFVECGVNRGFLSTAIMTYLPWNSLKRRFFLFDTFCGLDEKQVSEEEKALGRVESTKAYYAECFEEAKKNFAEFKNVVFVRGTIPDTLNTVDIKSVAYLSIDMNCVAPEIAAASHFWDKLVTGAVVLLDDYAYYGYEPQKKAFDQFAAQKGFSILSLPTGQGLFIKR